jgi:hypothetical protein
LSVVFVRSRRARRYLLRVEDDGRVRVTIPRGGSRAEAERVVRRHLEWVERQRYLRLKDPGTPGWRHGTEVFFRGSRVALTLGEAGGRRIVTFADQALIVRDDERDLKGAVERHLRELAVRELPPRLLELAAQHKVPVTRVSVRDQRSLWGSCSARGSISLSWRLVLMPDAVRDYILLHELAHVGEQNHSRRFWRRVEEMCPGHRDARLWIRRHGRALR